MVAPTGESRPVISIAFVSPVSGWAVGCDGTIIHTEDAGETWTPQIGETDEDLQSVSFGSSRSGWAVGKNGAILHWEE
jgi:photosystem II stability/assembly factor-like uncharacterized protein